MADVVGAVIDQGASDWQVFQQNDKGVADIALSGRWGGPKMTAVEIRLVREDTGMPPARHLDWQRARAGRNGAWSGMLRNVPAGGLYRIETHLLANKNDPQEWGVRGDMRHFIGVGDLWIIAGQSNSVGYGRGPSYDQPELGVHVFNNAMRWALASQPLNDSTDTAHAENREGGNGGHSPWLHWARLVKQEVGFPIGLIQTSLGGSPLSSWNPTEEGLHPLYELMVRAVKAAGGRARGVLWYQGCSDTSSRPVARSYERRFAAAVRAWRKALKSPRLAVMTVQINRCIAPAGDEGDLSWTILREAQRRLPHRLSGVTVVPTLDLPLSDGIHNSPQGNSLLAHRVAQAALASVYGRDVDYLAPEPASARAADGGRVIELALANIRSRIATIDPGAIPFRVEDAEGVVPVQKVEYPARTHSNVLRLHLGRKLSGRAVVHGGYGVNPPIVPVDGVSMAPMLGFHGFPVTG